MTVLGGAVLVLASAAFNGFVVASLWMWFMVPLGLPMITIAHAYGISSLIGFVSARRKWSDKAESFAEAVAGGFVTSLLWWSFGWLVHKLMEAGL